VAGIIVFAIQGPLKPGWARRAGTPVTLLAAAPPLVATRTVSAPQALRVPFAASLPGGGLDARLGAPG
jgi:hypothetical protein